LVRCREGLMTTLYGTRTLFPIGKYHTMRVYGRAQRIYGT